jgi:hypothetical protein
VTIPATAGTGRQELLAGTELGAIASLAMGGQRDLMDRLHAYPQLFPAKPFDAALVAGVAYGTACNASWAAPEALWVANRAALWIFALDWQVDTLAESVDQVEEIRAGCIAVADGAVPNLDAPLTGFLAEIRDELAKSPALAAHRDLWRDELQRTLDAMAREWSWKSALAAGADLVRPDIRTYLDNADNTGLAWVNISHWIYTGDQESLDNLDELRTVGKRVQQVLRLVNDLATYDRDVQWGKGDLNVLMLGIDRVQVEQRITDLITGCLALLGALETRCPRQASYLARQLGFVTRFYGGADFWGIL